MDNMHGYDPQAKRDCSSDSLTAHFSSATMTIDNQSPAAAATATQRNDVLYPFTPINSNSDNNNNHHRQSSGNNNNNDTVLQADVLQSYISHHDENAELEEPELQRQYTARLDDLLADGEKQATAAIGRRYSLYAANIQVKFPLSRFSSNGRSLIYSRRILQGRFLVAPIAMCFIPLIWDQPRVIRCGICW